MECRHRRLELFGKPVTGTGNFLARGLQYRPPRGPGKEHAPGARFWHGKLLLVQETGRDDASGSRRRGPDQGAIHPTQGRRPEKPRADRGLADSELPHDRPCRTRRQDPGHARGVHGCDALSRAPPAAVGRLEQSRMDDARLRRGGKSRGRPRVRPGSRFAEERHRGWQRKTGPGQGAPTAQRSGRTSRWTPGARQTTGRPRSEHPGYGLADGAFEELCRNPGGDRGRTGLERAGGEARGQSAAPHATGGANS